jgi:hypothetical protein
MIAESMDLLWGQTSTLKPHSLSVEKELTTVEAMEELTTVTDALSAKARKTIAGLRRREGPSKRP